VEESKRGLGFLPKEKDLSRTRDLVDQIKQITIEIRDIKERRKNKINFTSTNYDTINVHSHSPSDSLQEGHEEHDEDGVHYGDSIQNNRPVPDNTYILEHCAPAQCPSPTEPTASPPLPPELHPSSPSSEIPVKTPSTKLLWSKSPSGPESPGIVEGNAVEEGDPPWNNTNSSWNNGGDDVGAPCKKAGV